MSRRSAVSAYSARTGYNARIYPDAAAGRPAGIPAADPRISGYFAVHGKSAADDELYRTASAASS